MAEEDARSDDDFMSADEDDDFDLPSDMVQPKAGAAGPPGMEGGALPPGMEDMDGSEERWDLRKDGNKEDLEKIWQPLSVEKEHVKISKMFSYVLRHAAHKMDVRIRKDGFVRLREIMKLRNFKPYNLEELMAVVYFDEKERYTMVREFDGELLIRANQGHTMKVVESDLLLEPVEDPDEIGECVHGTYLVHWPFIKRQGLSKVARNHIHLANGLPEDGKIRGMRSTAELFVYVDVKAAMLDGVVFYKSKNDVILTIGIQGWLPVKYFTKAVRIDYQTCEIEEMEYDKDAELPQWAAELAPIAPVSGENSYVVKNLDSLISSCKKKLTEINELKGAAENGQELTPEEEEKVAKHAKIYTELQSLEQRFRQHKGHRRENAEDKEKRVREEMETTTLVHRKDRAVTPPWERGRKGLESVGENQNKISDKEKAQWAAIGQRRENAANEPAPERRESQKEDPWEKMGRARQDTDGKTPTASSDRRDEGSRFGEDFRFGGGGGKGGKGRKGDDDDPRREDSRRSDADDSWRRSAGPDDKKPSRQESKEADEGSKDRPRFLNSTKSDKPSWRDKMANPELKEKPEPPPPPPPQEPSWRGDRDEPRQETSFRNRDEPRQEPSWRGGDRDEPRKEPSWRDRMPQAEDAAPPAARKAGGWRDRMSADPPPQEPDPAPPVPPPQAAPAYDAGGYQPVGQGGQFPMRNAAAPAAAPFVQSATPFVPNAAAAAFVPSASAAPFVPGAMPAGGMQGYGQPQSYAMQQPGYGQQQDYGQQQGNYGQQQMYSYPPAGQGQMSQGGQQQMQPQQQQQQQYAYPPAGQGAQGQQVFSTTGQQALKLPTSDFVPGATSYGQMPQQQQQQYGQAQYSQQGAMPQQQQYQQQPPQGYNGHSNSQAPQASGWTDEDEEDYQNEGRGGFDEGPSQGGGKGRGKGGGGRSRGAPPGGYEDQYDSGKGGKSRGGGGYDDQYGDSGKGGRKGGGGGYDDQYGDSGKGGRGDKGGGKGSKGGNKGSKDDRGGGKGGSGNDRGGREECPW